ncbi:hypothetical protein [Shouchella clausii]|uniref:Uncharacterized protein n=1 Tax=Shouchella clausii (strain KSM-K16) TaxID=66692 RepID=Q5WLB6_SHOC1|nr:hypothetical protein [Shouchella clausii]KKI85462.1 hypothetical protein WZ76_15445 [Shouchella clausii]BAD62839.1 hypothetical protein ABC0297 [Shouchella clausii KSM-K16]
MNKFFTLLLICMIAVITYLVIFNNTENSFGDTNGITVEFEDSKNKEPIQIKSEKDIEYIQHTLNNIKWGDVIEISASSPPDYVVKDEAFSFSIWVLNSTKIEVYDEKEKRLGVIPVEDQEEFLNIIDP